MWIRLIDDHKVARQLAGYFVVNLGYLLGQSDDPTVHEDTDDGAASIEAERVTELESLGAQLSQLSEDTRRMVAAVIREAYRIDRETERLVEGYTVNLTAKKRRQV